MAIQITFVTTNAGKVRSLQQHLEPFGIAVSQESIDLPEPRSSDVQVIAEQKARHAYGLLQKPLVVLDAGFYILSLNGFPRAFVNFALETIGIEGILRLVAGKDRACEFRECLAFFDGSDLRYFNVRIPGRIADTPQGVQQPHHWSALVRIFIPDGFEKTLAQMDHDEYMAWSIAVQKGSLGDQFAAWYVQYSSK